MIPGFASGFSCMPVSISSSFANTHSVVTSGTSTATAGYINLGQPASWSVNANTTEMTWAIWFRRNGRDGRILSCRVNSGAQFDLALATNTVQVVLGDNFFSGGTSLGDGNWHHVVITSRDEGGGGNIARAYQDSNTSSIGNTTAGSLTNTSYDWLIGQQHGNNNTDFAFGAYSNIYVAHLTVWTTGFTGADSAELYNGGTPIDPTTHSKAASLITYMPLGSGDTSPSLRSVVGTVSGTMTNTPTCSITTDHP